MSKFVSVYTPTDCLHHGYIWKPLLAQKEKRQLQTVKQTVTKKNYDIKSFGLALLVVGLIDDNKFLNWMTREQLAH